MAADDCSGFKQFYVKLLSALCNVRYDTRTMDKEHQSGTQRRGRCARGGWHTQEFAGLYLEDKPIASDGRRKHRASYSLETVRAPSASLRATLMLLIHGPSIVLTLHKAESSFT